MSQAKKILLISEKKEDRLFIDGIIASTGLNLNQVSTSEEGAKIMSNEEVGAIFVDVSHQTLYDHFEFQVQEKMGLFSDRVFPNAIHFITPEDLPSIQYLIRSPLFGNYVLREAPDFFSAGKHYGRIVKMTHLPKAFGIQNFFGDSVQTKIIEIQMSSQKQPVVEGVKNYLISLSFSVRSSMIIANAVDELLMNAIFDAPTDDLGNSRFARTSRSESFPLTGQQEVELKIGFDGEYIAISVADHFGSLDQEKLLSHISKIYASEEYKVKNSFEGAGIGLATIFRSGGSFLFASDAKKRTEVTVFFKKLDSLKDFKNQFRFISTQFYVS